MQINYSNKTITKFAIIRRTDSVHSFLTESVKRTVKLI